MAISIPLQVTFTGDDADNHRLPAYNATESLDGIARTTLIVVNYLAEGKVRHRDYKYSEYEFDIVAIRPGSFDVQFIINFLSDHIGLLSAVGFGVAGNLATDVIKSVFRRSIGKSAPTTIEALEAEDKLNAGDMGALVEAVAPAIRRGHKVINYGATNIAIISGTNNIVQFTPKSKAYVEKNVRDDEIRAKLFSVGSYNANTRHGRVYDFELNQTIAFDLPSDVDFTTLKFIADSHRNYTLNTGGQHLSSAIGLLYTRITSIDGRTKKMIVLKARNDIADLSS